MIATPNQPVNITSRLLAINGLAAIWAVLHHMNHWALMAMFWWTDRYREVSVPNFDLQWSARYYLLRLIDQPSAAVVPVFLFVSGFFISFAAGSKGGTVSWKLVFNRLKVLLIPYLVWCGVIIAYQLIDEGKLDPLATLRQVVTGTIVSPYYYVILLMQLYLLSPLLLPLVRRWGKAALLAAALLQIPELYLSHAILTGNASTLPPVLRLVFVDWHVPAYLFWFLLGIYIKLHISQFKQFLERNRRWLPVPALLAAALSVFEWVWMVQASGANWVSVQNLVFNRFFAFFTILWFLSLRDVENRLPAWLSWVGARSFSIYLIHPIVLTVFARLTYHFAPWLLGYPVAFGLILAATGVLVPVLMLRLVAWTPAQRYEKLLLGG